MNCSLKTFFCEGLGVGIWNRFRLERGGSHTLKRQSRKRSAYAKDGGEVNVAGLVQIFFLEEWAVRLGPSFPKAWAVTSGPPALHTFSF